MTGIGLLAGTRVLDLTKLLPGPYATMVLADLGAEVIKVEHPDPTKDMARFQPPFLEGNPKTSAFYYQINRNKQSITLDYTRPEGREILLALVRHADVLVESFRPGTMDRWDLGRAVLEATNPRLVLCSVSGYGQDGPAHGDPGHDMNYLARSGLLSMSGEPGGPPLPFPIPLADYIGGLHAATGVVAALAGKRDRFVHVDAAIFESAFSLLHLYNNRHATGQPDFEKGEETLSGFHPFYRAYRCKDGKHLVLGAIEQKFWDAFCKAIGRPDLKDEQFSGTPYVASALGMTPRLAPGELASLLEATFLERDRDDWVALLNEKGVCCDPVSDVASAWRDPHVTARGMLVPVDDPRHPGTFTHLRFPVLFNGEAAAIAPAPVPGQDNEAILGGLAGLDPDRLRQLKKKRVV